MAFIYIKTNNRFIRSLLVSGLESKLDGEYKILCDQEFSSHIQSREPHTGKYLVLRDYAEIDLSSPWVGLDIGTNTCQRPCYLAIYNVSRRDRLQKNLVEMDVSGIFFRNDTLATLAKGIAAILNGEHWYPRELLMKWLTMETRRDSDYPELTRREKEILLNLASGLSNTEIADNLCISYHTVKNHLVKIFRKIDARDRFQASLWASRYLTTPRL